MKPTCILDMDQRVDQQSVHKEMTKRTNEGRYKVTHVAHGFTLSVRPTSGCECVHSYPAAPIGSTIDSRKTNREKTLFVGIEVSNIRDNKKSVVKVTEKNVKPHVDNSLVTISAKENILLLALHEAMHHLPSKRWTIKFNQTVSNIDKEANCQP